MFDPIDKSTLVKLGFTVGVDSAIRHQLSKLFVIHADGSWDAIHFYNNFKMSGKEACPIRAYRQALAEMRLAIENGGVSATQQT